MNLGDNNLRPLRVLGQGSFGRVFLCKCRDGNKERTVCVKRIIVENPRTEMHMILEEVYIISQLKHPHIVQFIRSFMHAGTVNIVMEYAPNGTMRDIITQIPVIPIANAKLIGYFCDILMGLEYLHIRHVIHRDIKPENLLVATHERIKIADFGISAIHTPSKQYLNVRGTPYYLAPEVMNGEKFDFKSDIWSLGCVLFEMCIGQNPFAQATNLSELRYLVRVVTRFKVNCHCVGHRYGAVWQRFCEQMLVYNPVKRISLPDLLRLDALITIPYYQKYFNYDYGVTAHELNY